MTLARRRNLFLTIASLIAICLVGTAALLKLQWDYVFVRPALDPRIALFETIESITPVLTAAEPDGGLGFLIDTNALKRPLELRLLIEPRSMDSYYFLVERHLAELKRKGLSVERYRPAEPHPELYKLAERSGRLFEGSTGYSRARLLTGIVTVGRGGGKEYVFLAATGQEVRNDDYPYYEFLFERLPDGDLHQLSSRRFVYGVAGIEGIEGWRAWLGVSFLLIIAGCIGFSAAVIMQDFHRWKQAKSPEASG